MRKANIQFSSVALSLILIPVRITLAGLPATILLSGTSFVTTEPAPTIHSLPIFTPGSNKDLVATIHLSPIYVSRSKGFVTSCASEFIPPLLQ